MVSSLIIPCYFKDESLMKMTLRCLESLDDYDGQVIVVDDGSPLNYHPKELYDGSRRVVCRELNGGYAAAVNSGLEVASGEILIVANNDIFFVPGWLDGLLLPFRKDYDISSIRTSDSDGYLVEDIITEGDKFGSIWAMTRSAYELLGPLDETFGKGTFEDLDYRRRALKAGLRIAKYHGVVVEHVGRATFHKIDPEHRLFRANRERYLSKWGHVE